MCSQTNNVKTESLQKKYKVNEDAYNDWVKRPELSITQICDKHSMTPQKLRAWIKTHNKKRPDENRVGDKRKQRQAWIAKAYERGLRKDLSANEVANWARKQCEFCIERVDIQYYANKFNLPSLKEIVSSHVTRETKYG